MATAAPFIMRAVLKNGQGERILTGKGDIHYRLYPIGNSVPQAPERPKGRWRRLPDNFLDALVTARPFVGKAQADYPWIMFAFLFDGKIYATDNQVLVEIDVGDHTLPATLFRTEEIRALSSWRTNPDKMLVGEDYNAFSWDDGSWVRLPRRRAGGLVAYPRTYPLIDRIRELLEHHWREPTHSIADEKRAKLLFAIRNYGRNSVVEISRQKIRVQEAGDGSRLGEACFGIAGSRKMTWPGKAVLRAVAVADKVDFSTKPACFTFPKGRGLIVVSSDEIVDV